MQVLCKAFDWMIQNAQYTTVQEVVGQAALFEVNKKEADQETHMPYDSWMDIQRSDHIHRCGGRYYVTLYGQRTKNPPTAGVQVNRKARISIRILRESIQEFQAWKDGEASRIRKGGGRGERKGERGRDQERKRATKRLRG